MSTSFTPESLGSVRLDVYPHRQHEYQLGHAKPGQDTCLSTRLVYSFSACRSAFRAVTIMTYPKGAARRKSGRLFKLQYRKSPTFQYSFCTKERRPDVRKSCSDGPACIELIRIGKAMVSILDSLDVAVTAQEAQEGKRALSLALERQGS
ncbi:hypothetical protein KC361_g61 [Hortaea werneckii]|nr:hypothetical protein KC361_g61 [Hortaea werneckii]